MDSEGMTISHEELLAGYHQRDQLLRSYHELAEQVAEREAAVAVVVARNRDLEDYLGQQDQHLAEKDQHLAAQDETIAEKQQRISELQWQVEKLQRLLYGSKRERFERANVGLIDGQLVLPFLTDPSLVKAKEAVVEAVKAEMQRVTNERKRAKKKHPGRLPLPAHLPVVEIIHEPTEDVSGMRCIGEEITDELDYTPAKLFIRRHIRRKYISDEDDQGKQYMVIAPLPEHPLPKCEASVELLTQIIIDKHVYHLPIYRQLQRFATLGVQIPSSTIDNWQRLLAVQLRPLYAALAAVCKTAGYLQADETTLKVQDRAKKGTTHLGVMWVYHAVRQRVVIFDYQRGHGKANCKDFLADAHGYLQTDGTLIYSEHKARADLIALACWAHARRKFHEALSDDPQRAEIALALIQQLYAVEAKARDGKLAPTARKELRLEQSLPVLNLFGQWLAGEVGDTLPKSPIGKAIRYAITLWDELQNYLYNGILEIDNNLVENLIRPLALGRKNYLFAGSHDAALPIAMYRSFFGTCTLNNIDPQAWLLYVLNHITSTPPEEYHTLLPQEIDPALLA